MTLRRRRSPIQNRFSSSFQWKRVKDFHTMEWTVRLLLSQFYNNTELLAILTIYLIHLFERVYSREVNRYTETYNIAEIIPINILMMSREPRTWALQYTTFTSLVATHPLLLGRPWLTPSSGSTGQALEMETRLLFPCCRTILYIGILYAIGQGILAFGAVGNGPEGIEGFPNMWEYF